MRPKLCYSMIVVPWVCFPSTCNLFDNGFGTHSSRNRNWRMTRPATSPTYSTLTSFFGFSWNSMTMRECKWRLERWHSNRQVLSLSEEKGLRAEPVRLGRDADFDMKRFAAGSIMSLFKGFFISLDMRYESTAPKVLRLVNAAFGPMKR